MRALSIVFALGLMGPLAAQAETIEQACMNSGREAANRSLSTCIQSVADVTLSHRQQVTAVGFLRNRDISQQVRQSNRRSVARFWKNTWHSTNMPKRHVVEIGASNQEHLVRRLNPADTLTPTSADPA